MICPVATILKSGREEEADAMKEVLSIMNGPHHAAYKIGIRLAVKNFTLSETTIIG